MEVEVASKTVTWTARILAYRRLEIIQELLRLYPNLTPSQLSPFYEKHVVQPVALCEPETTD